MLTLSRTFFLEAMLSGCHLQLLPRFQNFEQEFRYGDCKSAGMETISLSKNSADRRVSFDIYPERIGYDDGGGNNALNQRDVDKSE